MIGWGMLAVALVLAGIVWAMLRSAAQAPDWDPPPPPPRVEVKPDRRARGSVAERHWRAYGPRWRV